MSSRAKKARLKPIWIQEEPKDVLSDLLDSPYYEDFYRDMLDDLMIAYYMCPSFTISDGYEPLGGFMCNTFEEFINVWFSGDYDWSECWRDFDPLDV